MTAPALVTLTGDGTFRWVEPGPDAAGTDAAEDARLGALMRLAGLLGDDLEDQVATRMTLPAALGTEAADHLLPASLALLAGTTGDLAGYGWRVGPGAGRAWHRARELRERTLEAARLALLHRTGPVTTTTLGPVTIAAATFLGTGERTLSDPGALRDLPTVLADGVAEHVRALRAQVPGAEPTLLLREDAVRPVLEGRITTPSGYRRYAPLPAPRIGELWQRFLSDLAGTEQIPRESVTLTVGSDPDLLQAARDAGARRLALSPAVIGPLRGGRSRQIWERIAEAHEDRVALEMIVDPARLGRDLDILAAAWTQLGYAMGSLAGTTLIAHHPGALAAAADPAAEPAPTALLDEAGIQQLLRTGPAWAERVQG